ncbi:MAG TPA: PAS domain S-box protein [Gemmataceae bacterium]|nr:PAS domain S-box protein [Gemmataceae bacterium]
MASNFPSGHPSPATVSETVREGTAGSGLSLHVHGRTILFLSSLLLLHAINPLAWGQIGSVLWFPPAGLGLALIAWFGPRAALWLALDGLLVVAQALMVSRYGSGQIGIADLKLAAADAILGAVMLSLAWRLYQTQTRATRDLHDPISAKRFLFLVPGLGAGIWAVLHTAFFTLLAEQSTLAWRTEFSAFWLSRALGVMILTPLLLLLLTPWLTRLRLVRPVPAESDSNAAFGGMGGSERLLWGEGLELVGLAASAGALTWLAVQNGRMQQLAGWQLWGAPLLLIVWASFRQGLRGGMVVASVSAGLPLLLLQGEPLAGVFSLLVQGNLLAQCAVALLAASSAGWVRIHEHRYRRVAGSLPIVIYSARFRRPDRPPLVAGELDAEVTLVNAASEMLIGCPPRELLGDHERWLAHVHADDREVLRAAIAQLGRFVQSVTCEYRLTSASEGNARWLRDTLAPQLDSEGRLIGWEGVLTDITEQRALADDLRRTTNMLHALVDNLPTGVFFVQGPSGHPILVNARARQLLGQREDMAAGLEHLSEVYRLHRHDGTLYPVEDLPVFLALRRGLTAMRDDIIVHRPDGRRTPLVTWAAPIRCPLSAVRPPHALEPKAECGERLAESGSEAAVWVMEDLTALHQAEAARRDTEVRLRAILETMSEGVLVRDRNGCVIDCNAAASVILGQAPEKLRGSTLADGLWELMREDGTMLAPEDYPAAVVLRMGRPVRNFVLGVVPRSGQAETAVRRDADPTMPDRRDAGPTEHGSTAAFKDVRWVLINTMPLGVASIGEQPAARGVVSTYIDITTTIRAQRMLRESEEKYRDLVESLPLMVIQADTDLRVTYANPATRKVTGYELNEITEPALWSRIVHPDDVPRLLAMGQEALAGRSARAEYRYRAKDGSDKVGLAFSEPRRRSDGAIIGTTTLIADITRERQLEQELLRAQRQELVGRLASGIAHDFNNLLSVVLSMSDLALDNLPPGHAARQDLERIQEATGQAANLANQLLTFSKQRRIATHRIDINAIIASTLDLLRASLPSRIMIKAELAERELFVKADETQVQQVVMNLCLNARDAMPSGGLLQVRTTRVSSEGDWVCLSVQDQGTGISEAVKAHLFDPFFSTKERGTGLGLAVVRHIVESHGGRIEVASELGQGARFEVWWPAVP